MNHSAAEEVISILDASWTNFSWWPHEDFTRDILLGIPNGMFLENTISTQLWLEINNFYCYYLYSPVNSNFSPAKSLALIKYSSTFCILPYSKYAWAISKLNKICNLLLLKFCSSLDSFAISSSNSEYIEALVSSRTLWWDTLLRNVHQRYS